MNWQLIASYSDIFAAHALKQSDILVLISFNITVCICSNVFISNSEIHSTEYLSRAENCCLTKRMYFTLSKEKECQTL